MTGNTKTGFTLVEVLIATTVMGVVMVLATNLLLLFFRSQDESRDILVLEGSARQIVTRIAEATREGAVDYDYYTSTPDAEPGILALRTLEGIQTVFWLYSDGSETNMYLCDNMPFDDSCDKTADPEAGGDWSQINSENTNFVFAEGFSIVPDDAPYLYGTSSDDAPVVTVILQLQIESTLTQSPVIQTSFTPRVYVR